MKQQGRMMWPAAAASIRYRFLDPYFIFLKFYIYLQYICIILILKHIFSHKTVTTFILLILPRLFLESDTVYICEMCFCFDINEPHVDQDPVLNRLKLGEKKQEEKKKNRDQQKDLWK